MSRIIGRQTRVIRCFQSAYGSRSRWGNVLENKGPAGSPIQFFPWLPPDVFDVGKGKVERANGQFGTVEVVFG